MDLSGIRESLPEVGEPLKKVCAVCQIPSGKSCSACHNVFYCSVEHQISHWKMHKKDCPPIRIATSPELGRHFVATRDLPPWSLLLTEFPVLVNPHEIIEDTFASCISCRSIITGDPSPCSQCSTLYFCNPSCSLNKIHSEFECHVLSKCSKGKRAILCKPPNLMYLRALGLKNSDPKIWEKVLKLRGADQYKPEDADEKDKWFIREILPLLGEKGHGFRDDMAKLRGIYQQRGVVRPSLISFSKGKPGHGESQLLYLKASKFAQNCFPNCAPIIDKGPQFQLQVRSIVEIKKGTITSIDFPRYFMGAMIQKHSMNLIGGAMCICPRCADPSGTELGAMLSAVKCGEPNCKDGYLLPVDPMDLALNAPWHCNRSGCEGKGSWDEIYEMEEGLKNDANLFIAKTPLGDVALTAEFLLSLEKKLHPNHGLILSIKNAMINNMHSEMEKEILLHFDLPMPAIQLYISMIDHMLKMTEFTVPGLSLDWGHLWSKLLTLLIKKLNAIAMERERDSCPKELVKEFKRRAIEGIEQFYSIAKFYPETWSKEYLKLYKGLIQPSLQLDLSRQ